MYGEPDCQFCKQGFYECNCEEVYNAIWVGGVERVTEATLQQERINPLG